MEICARNKINLSYIHIYNCVIFKIASSYQIIKCVKFICVSIHNKHEKCIALWKPLGPWSKTNLLFEWGKVSSRFNPPCPLEWDTLNTELLGSNFVLCGRWIKIKLVPEGKTLKSILLVNKIQNKVTITLQLALKSMILEIVL